MSEHHKENFITKYIFSMDHKMIAKQFLITGMFMGVVGMTMSILFIIQVQMLIQLSSQLEMLHGARVGMVMML